MNRAERPALGDAEARVARILYLSVGIGGLVYVLVGNAKATEQFGSLEPIWAHLTWYVTAAAPVALGILSLWAPLRLIAAIASAYGIFFAAVMATWRIAQISPTLPDSNSPWTNDFMAVAAIAVAISWGIRSVGAYVLITSLLSGVIRYAADPEIGVKIPLLDLSYNLLFDCVFVAITLVTRVSARRLDRAADAARTKTALEAEASARVQQRVRIDALVHDHVLSALLIASRADGAPTPALRALATSTLGMLENDALLPQVPMAVSDFVNRLRSSVTTQSDGIGFEATVSGTGTIPADTAQALLEATAEGVRNSLRHADRGDGTTWRRVSVTADDSGVSIRVGDNGQGFNSRRIPPERLGVRVSILNRMATVPGGHADVESARGIGTRVAIGWTDPEVHP
jgi:signal transduction histidine kinase